MGTNRKRLRVGVIGLGGIAQGEHLPHWQSSDGAELVAIADVDQTKLQQTASKLGLDRAFTDWRELVRLDDLDIVDVTTPNCFHAPMTLAALEAGKHVLCEKPMATNADDALRMLQAAQRHDRRLMINHHLRFSQSLRALHALAKRGDLGRIYAAQACWTRRRGVPTLPTFIDTQLAQGGPVLDLGIHMLDLACWLMGFPGPKRVSAAVGCHLAHNDNLGNEWGPWDRGRYSVEDFGVGLIHFADGATLHLEVSWLAFQPQLEERRLAILGSKAGAHWPQGVICSETEQVPVNQQLIHPEDGRPFERSIHEFVQAILHDAPTPVPPAESLQAVQLVDAFYRSAREGREVLLPPAENGPQQ